MIRLSGSSLLGEVGAAGDAGVDGDGGVELLVLQGVLVFHVRFGKVDEGVQMWPW